MQSGVFGSSDVQFVSSRVLVNGVEREHVSWSVDRELSGDLPAQVAASSGIMQATGSVVWAPVSDVTDKPANPWSSSKWWVPKRGDRVEVFAGNETTEWKQFTGVIDKTTGSIGGAIQSTVIDRYDDLSNTVTHAPLLSVMPPSTEGGSFRGTGLVYTYYVDLAMRAGKFFTTPGREPNSVTHVPCQGGMWPHYGNVISARTNSGASYPSNHFSPWGFAVGDFLNLYEPVSPQSMSAPVQITMIVAPTSNGYAILRAQYGTSYVELYVDAAWNVHARLNGNTVASFAMTGKSGAENRIVQMLVKGGVFTIKSSNGQSAVGSASFSGSTLMSVVRAEGDPSARVSGLQVSHPVPSSEFASLDFKPSAIMNTSNVSFMGIPRVIPAIEGVSGQDLLQEIGEASLSAAWIDELGVLQWWPSLAIRSQPVYDTVDTLDDVFELQWEDSILGSRSSVTVKYMEPALRVSSRPTVELAVGSGETLGSGDVSEQFYTPETDVVWVMPDYVQENVGPGNWAPYNVKSGTLAGMYFTSNGDEIMAVHPVTISNQRLGVTGAMKMTHTAGTFPAGIEAQLSTSPTDASLKVQNRDKPLPRIAGFGRAEYLEQEYKSLVPGGVGPALVHDTGKWIPADIVPRIADFLAGETATPQPVITGLRVAFNPRRQLGDVIRIESKTYMGVSLTVLIVGVSTDASDGGVSQSLSVRVFSVERSGMTYSEYDSSLSCSSLTYSQWQALGPLPQTYSEFNNS